MLYNAMREQDPSDSPMLDAPICNTFPSLKHGVLGLRLGRLRSDSLAGVSAETLTNYEMSLTLFGVLGANIVPISWPNGSDYNGAIDTIIMAEAHASYGSMAKDPCLLLGDSTRADLSEARQISETAYSGAFEDQQKLMREFAAIFDDVDAILTPTVPMAAPPIDQIDRRRPPTNFTRIVNFSRLCALAVPNGVTPYGLPTSLQIVCREFGEATALQIGWAYENATDWRQYFADVGRHFNSVRSS
jgi:aspartyl-tRNA(Asn)/glutamyl-tRNA(Gln) amidotransferase subunit A